MKRTILVIVGTVLVAASWQAVADTLPPYTRPTGQGTEFTGHPGGTADATYSTWGFGTAIPIVPSTPGAPILSDRAAWGGHVVPTVNWPVSGGQFTGNAYLHSYLPQLDTHAGVVGLSGKLELNIPNTPLDHNREKWLQVQLDWKPLAAGDRPIVTAQSSGFRAITTPDWLQTTTALTDGWFSTTFSSMGFDDLVTPGLHHNPTGEMIVLEGNVYVDNVIIDTACVPEPGQVAMMVITGLGAVGYGVRRYRGRKQS